MLTELNQLYPKQDTGFEADLYLYPDPCYPDDFWCDLDSGFEPCSWEEDSL